VRGWSNGRVGLSGNSWLGIAQWFIAADQPPHLAAIAPWEGLSDDAAVSPASLVASWTNGAHTPGTFGAFQRIASPNKWLRVHNNHEWPDLYENTEDLRSFFDHYLQGIENGWETTPRIRLSILDPGGIDQIDRPEHEFPLARTHYQTLYLDARTGTLSPNAVDTEAAVQYRAGSQEQALFSMHFDQDTVLTGFMKLRLWVETRGANDMDLFVLIQKLDQQGNVLAPIVLEEVFDGSIGRLRVSHRQLDPALSTQAEPYLTHTEEQLLNPGQIVPVEIAITPISLLWHAGQQLRVTIAGYNTAAHSFPRIIEHDLRNAGQHIIHAGGRYDSHLLIPAIPQ
jgi:uncharacterized protein